MFEQLKSQDEHFVSLFLTVQTLITFNTWLQLRLIKPRDSPLRAPPRAPPGGRSPLLQVTKSMALALHCDLPRYLVPSVFQGVRRQQLSRGIRVEEEEEGAWPVDTLGARAPAPLDIEPCFGKAGRGRSVARSHEGIVGKCKHPRAQALTYRTVTGSECQDMNPFPQWFRNANIIL